MTNNAKVGGVLTIVAGAFGVLSLFMFIGLGVMMLVIPGRFGSDFNYGSNGFRPEAFFAVMAAIYILMGIFYAMVGAMAIVGGVFALRKRHWAWALAGAIAGTVVFMPCGIPAIIFVSMGRPEFLTALPSPTPATSL